MSYTSEDIWARELYKINQPNPFSGHITPTAPNDYSGRALTHGPNYNAQEAAHPFPASFTNPAGSNINCSAVALARLHSYNVGANALQEETLGYLPNGQGLDIPTRPGIDLDDMDVFMKELCSTSTTQRFFPQGGKSAGEIMCACYVPPPGPSTFAASVVACTRRDGIGHAHSNFGMPADHTVMNADAITVFSPGAYLSSLEQREANERRLDLFIEGKMSYHEWASGERTQDEPVPSFEAFSHHVKASGQ